MEKEIRIKFLDNGCFDVIVEDRSTDQLSFDEMLGVIAQLTMPENRRCLNWFKTEEEHKAFRNLNVTSYETSEVEFEEEKEDPDNDVTEKLQLKCWRETSKIDGKKILEFTKGRVYEFERTCDPEGWETTNDNGKKEVFFDTHHMFEEI